MPSTWLASSSWLPHPSRIRLHRAAAKAISFDVPPVEFSLGEFADTVGRIAAAADTEDGHAFWQDKLDRLRRVISPAMEKPNSAPLEEDYMSPLYTRSRRH